MPPPDVVVLGALHLDVLVNAPGLPRRDETLIGTKVRYVQGGKGGNQAVAAARMGAATAMKGRIGDDAFGTMLRTALEASGVDAAHVVSEAGTASGMSTAIIEPDGSYAAVVVSGANLALGAETKLPPGFAILCLQNEVPEPANLAAARQAKAQGARVLLNAAPARMLPDALAALVDLLVVNRLEATDLTGESDPARAVLRLRDRLRPGATVIVTLGAEGLVAASADALPVALPAPRVRQISSHGAGDRFVGALAAELARNAALSDALATAQAAAALHVASDDEARAQMDRAAVIAFRDSQPAIR